MGSTFLGSVDLVEKGGEIGGLGDIEPPRPVLGGQAKTVGGLADETAGAAFGGVMPPAITLGLEQAQCRDLVDDAGEFAGDFPAFQLRLPSRAVELVGASSAV